MFKMVYTEPWGFREEKSVKIKNQIFVVSIYSLQTSKTPKKYEIPTHKWPWGASDLQN